MCGIVGRINFNHQPVSQREIKLMCEAIKHRGPDDEGIWVNRQVGLGSRRLSIIDLSPKGRQPITNESGSVRVVLNGEIYNYAELRKKLINRGHRFYSQSDTETIIHLWEEYGINCVKWLRGMFAFALWDEKQQLLFLVRDRLGKKPLKYYLDDKKLIFASELKAILKDKDIRREPDFQAIDHYFGMEAVPEPLTGFKQIKKLPAASYLLVKKGKIEIKKYWEIDFTPKLTLGFNELKAEILSQLKKSVQLRMVADVEVGAFLSGGIDSSAIVALMSQLGQKKINTFSVGFADPAYSELYHARLVAKKFKTQHHELILKPQSFSLLPKLAVAYEEPYGDPSALPTYLISQLASQTLKVVLNGDGGDENFAGYQRYQKFGPLNWVSRLLPSWSRNLIKAGLNRSWPTLADLINQPGFGQYASAYLGFNSPLSFKQSLYNQEFFSQINPLATQSLFLNQLRPQLQPLDNVLLTDFHLYLAQVLLPKVDIASMAHGLEVRSPFLDQELVQFCAKIPPSLKLKQGVSKYILKKALEGILPNEIIYRPKMGFGFPLGQWLKSQWKKDVSHIILNKKALLKNYLNQTFIAGLINHPQSGEHNDRRLWRILMFELWLKNYFG